MSRFTVNADDTVTDNQLRLLWQRPTNAKYVDQASARKVLAELTKKDGRPWRFATVDELQTLPDRSRHEPAIDTEIFPDTESAGYWTDTPCSWSPKSAVWVVGFNFGGVYYHHRYFFACLRAVCELPAGQ